MIETLLVALTISITINALLFVVAFYFKSDKLTDASYALSFIVLSLFALQQSTESLHTIIATALVCIWALRIGSFLLYRVIRSGTDKRFDGIRESFWKFGKFWLAQAITVWILMIPILLATTNGDSWNIFTLIGIIIWLCGFIIESVADLQKLKFTQKPANKDKWIDNGIWRYSRHPNYFGEILVWFGIYVYSLPNLSTGYRFAGLLSPIFISVLLIFVSGIPILEKAADKRWGNKPTYRAYKRTTSILIPLPKKNQ